MLVTLAKTTGDMISFVTYILLYVQNKIIYNIFSYSVHVQRLI